MWLSLTKPGASRATRFCVMRSERNRAGEQLILTKINSLSNIVFTEKLYKLGENCLKFLKMTWIRDPANSRLFKNPMKVELMSYCLASRLILNGWFTAKKSPGFWEPMMQYIEGNSVWIKLVPKTQFRKFGTCAWFCWRTSQIVHGSCKCNPNSGVTIS